MKGLTVPQAGEARFTYNRIMRHGRERESDGPVGAKGQSAGVVEVGTGDTQESRSLMTTDIFKIAAFRFPVSSTVVRIQTAYLVSLGSSVATLHIFEFQHGG